jgi:glyoxylase-like metal-dependent hydrolase (beta-lactamase superfamily II)
MILKHFRLNPIEVNTFLFGCSETKEVMIVDLGEWDERIPNYVNEHGLTVTKIFITHDHGDHTDAVQDAIDAFHPETISGTEAPGGIQVDEVVGHGDTVTIGNIEGYTVDTSGHTPVARSLIFPKVGIVFTGDALFSGSVGGTKSPENFDLQISNIKKNLLTLPDDYELYVGHGPATTIGIERTSNPFFN